MRDTEREAETQAEGEAGSMQGARRGTGFQVSRIMPWAEGGAKPLSHLGCPHVYGHTETGHWLLLRQRILCFGGPRWTYILYSI